MEEGVRVNKKRVFFLPDPQFSRHNVAKHYAEIFLIFFLTYISLFHLVVFLVVKFNTNIRHRFLIYMLTRRG